eukprot:6475020-Amphidinium_carterae.2
METDSYSLEGVTLLDSHVCIIDAFEFKCLRKLLKAPSTYMDRTWSQTFSNPPFSPGPGHPLKHLSHQVGRRING